MGTAEEAVKEAEEKVRNWLGDLVGGYEVGSEGIMSFRLGSTHVFIRVHPFIDDASVVEAYSIVLEGVDRSPALYEEVAFRAGSAVFGRLFLEASDEDDSKVSVIFANTILGTYMDPEEFNDSVRVVAMFADEIDDELQQKFGGTRFHE